MRAELKRGCIAGGQATWGGGVSRQFTRRTAARRESDVYADNDDDDQPVVGFKCHPAPLRIDDLYSLQI